MQEKTSRDSVLKAQAVDWFVKAKDICFAPAQRQALAEWRGAAENAKAYDSVNETVEDFRRVADTPEMLGKRKAVYGRVRARQRSQRRRAYLASAACFAALVGALAVYEDFSRPLFSWSTPAQKMYATAVGQRSTVPLDDGSVLTLDTDTVTRVRYDGDARFIRLDRGQAVFEVAKGDRRPFVVHAGDRRVVATGTAFDVKLDSGAIEITLMEGRVTVDQRAQTGSIGATVLQPGERLTAHVGGPATVRHVNLESVTSWTSGMHVFKEVTLLDAVREVNRYTDAKVSVGDVSLNDLAITGFFTTGKPLDFARMVAEVNGLSVAQTADGALRIEPREK